MRSVRAASPGGLAAAIGAVLLLAAAVRVASYTGFFGSDEVTYVHAAFRVLGGDWRLDDYVGANRLGVNLPIAAFAALFGRNEAAAALWSLLASLGEVALVTWAGWRFFGARVGVMAGVLLATLPSHAHFAGRLMADAPLALFITACFVLFMAAEARRWAAGYALAGACAAATFLIKPQTLFIFGVLLAWPLLARRWDWRWTWMAAGFVAGMAVNGLLYLAVTGRFWYVFKVMSQRMESGYLQAGAEAGEILSSPWTYLVYLFGKVWHTGLLGPLAAAGVLVQWHRGRLAEGETRLVLLWGLGMLALLSLLPVSFAPLMLIPKQTNYMLMFAAPLCLLAAIALAAAGRWGVWGATLASAVGLGFALMLQANVAVFTANSRATLQVLPTLPAEAPLYVMTNASRLADFEGLVAGSDAPARVRPVAELRSADASTDRFAVIDPQTFAWDDRVPWPRAGDAPACWQPLQTLQGQPQGVGAAVVRWMLRAMPASFPSDVERRLRALTEPQAATLYRLPAGCR